MIVLHNKFDKASRDFIESSVDDGDIVLDWYDAHDQALWIEFGGTLQIEGFPAVIVETPAYSLDGQEFPKGQIALFAPKGLEDVNEKIDDINKVLESAENKPALIDRESAPSFALKTKSAVINEQLEQFFLGLLEKHRGKPYVTPDLTKEVAQLKVAVTDYNRLGLYEEAALMIQSIKLPPEMDADKQAVLIRLTSLLGG